MNFIKGTLLLTRWKEYAFFVLPLTLLGPLIANNSHLSIFDYKLYAVLLGNFATVAFAFMINDVEDAEDDKFIKSKLFKNPISSGVLTKKSGYLLSLSTALVAFIAFFFLGGPVLWLGTANILISYLYSSKFVRLKKWPLIDIISHALMLGSLLILTSYYTYSKSLDAAGYLVAAAFFISAYGQIYNQLRDYNADKKAGLKNTSITIGKKGALFLAKLSAVSGIACILLALIRGIIPLWLLGIFPLLVLVSLMFKSENDITGREIKVKTGKAQLPAYLVMNVGVLIWFILSIISPSN